jgi:hypothetical protein
MRTARETGRESGAPGKACWVEVCENPETGDWYVKGHGACSPTYLRRFKQVALSRGIVFPPEADAPASPAGRAAEQEGAT